MTHDLLVTRDGGVLRMTIDRPEKLNALTRSTIDALRCGFEEAGRDAATRVIVLTGTGRAFCAGQDLGDPSVVPGSDLGEVLERHYNPLVRAMREIEKPVLARVNGIAAGAGANLAFACDIVLAGASATFVESFSRIGLLPDSGGTWMLPRLVGHARAVALAMLGSPLDARQAYEWGAIWKVVPDGELDAACDELAHALSRAPTKALGAIKAAMAASWSQDLGAQLETERNAQRVLGATRDFHEGVEAFARKREPSFRGE
jgi:2-(1,2-epoxy-1,2-dihydrophenyl)acetyl-CoA isomerase